MIIRIGNPSWKLFCDCVNYVTLKNTSFFSSAGHSLLIKPKINPTFKIDISKTMTTNAEVISSTANFVKNALEGNDGSHDFAHIERVWNLAKTIGKHTGKIFSKVKLSLVISTSFEFSRQKLDIKILQNGLFKVCQIKNDCFQLFQTC